MTENIKKYLEEMDGELINRDGTAEISHEEAKKALRDVYLLSCGKAPEFNKSFAAKKTPPMAEKNEIEPICGMCLREVSLLEEDPSFYCERCFDAGSKTLQSLTTRIKELEGALRAFPEHEDDIGACSQNIWLNEIEDWMDDYLQPLLGDVKMSEVVCPKCGSRDLRVAQKIEWWCKKCGLWFSPTKENE